MQGVAIGDSAPPQHETPRVGVFTIEKGQAGDPGCPCLDTK